MTGQRWIEWLVPRPTPSRSAPAVQAGRLVLILMVAAGLRFWHLNRWSLWFDEVVALRLARTPGPAEMFSLLNSIDGTRALYTRSC